MVDVLFVVVVLWPLLLLMVAAVVAADDRVDRVGARRDTGSPYILSRRRRDRTTPGGGCPSALGKGRLAVEKESGQPLKQRPDFRLIQHDRGDLVHRRPVGNE